MSDSHDVKHFSRTDTSWSTSWSNRILISLESRVLVFTRFDMRNDGDNQNKWDRSRTGFQIRQRFFDKTHYIILLFNILIERASVKLSSSFDLSFLQADRRRNSAISRQIPIGKLHWKCTSFMIPRFCTVLSFQQYCGEYSRNWKVFFFYFTQIINHLYLSYTTTLCHLK